LLPDSQTSIECGKERPDVDGQTEFAKVQLRYQLQMIYSTADSRVHRRTAAKDPKLIVNRRTSGGQRLSKAFQQHRWPSRPPTEKELLTVNIAKLLAEKNERFLMRI
jgi:hypothetical protein